MIPYGRHSILQEDIDFVSNALRSDWLTTGPLVAEFESDICEKVGAPAITVTSGTAALHCAYAAIGIKPGDEIITPPITFVATQATAALMGGKIIFADVQADTANLDPIKVEAAITNKTKAVVAVDFAGHPADLDELRKITNKHNLFLIEDAAHSIGSVYKNRPVGSIADLTTFSFFPTKNMTTGEGGAVSSLNPVLLERAKRFSRQGLVREEELFQLENDGPWHQEVQEFGLNYRLPDILCALGISQIKRLEASKIRRRQIFDFYKQALSEIDWIRLPVERDYVESNWHLFPIRVETSIRRALFTWMRECGIGVQVNYIPAYRHPAFRNNSATSEALSNSELFYAEEISLPMHLELRQGDLDRIVQSLKLFGKGKYKKNI